jgi:hypothetical protein
MPRSKIVRLRDQFNKEWDHRNGNPDLELRLADYSALQTEIALKTRDSETREQACKLVVEVNNMLAEIQATYLGEGELRL